MLLHHLSYNISSSTHGANSASREQGMSECVHELLFIVGTDCCSATLQVAIVCEGYRRLLDLGACQKVRPLLHINFPVWAHQGQSHYDSSEREALYLVSVSLASSLGSLRRRKGLGMTRKDRGKEMRLGLKGLDILI